jgi:Tol biopolymer transport system component
MRRLLSCAILASALFAAAPLAAQRNPADSGGGRGLRELPLRPSQPLKFTTDEGTWLSLDLSPDGKTIVFDLLGDLYTLPVAGGKATRITSGQAFDAQPKWSPDGKSIVFVSDRNGSDNLWLMNADGSHPRMLTRDEQRQFVSPTWTPDGKYVVVSKNNSLFGSQYDLYMYHRDGGTGLRLTGTDAAAGRGAPAPPVGGRGGAEPNNFVGPAFGKDARYIYTALRNGAGGYNQTSLGWQIGVYDRETGKNYTRTNAPGAGMRPELSPDGRWLVYATRQDSNTALRIRDLATGDERSLAPSVQRDDQESRFTRDLVPPFSFTPDSKAIVIAHHGKIWRIDVADGRQTMIPFSADVDQMIAGAIKREYPYDDSLLTIRQIRSARPSPDGKRLALVALDKLWLMDLPNGKARRVTTSTGTGEFAPDWSPDGRYIAYVTWSEQGGGDVYRVRADGQGKPERLTTASAFYDKLAYTPDGKKIVVIRGPREQRRDRDELGGNNAEAAGLELVSLPATGGPSTTITMVTRYGQPHFGPDSARVYIYEPNEGLVSMRFDGTDRRALLRASLVEGAGGRGGNAGQTNEVLLSPDGERALVQAETHLYLINSVPMTGGAAPSITLLNPAQSAVPVRRLTRIGGDFPGWSRDGKQIYYSIGHAYFTYDVARADSVVRDSVMRAEARGEGRGARGDSTAQVATRPAYEPAQTDVVITVPKDKPTGTVVLRGARIITMKGDEVIAGGDVVVRDNRIAAVGPTGSVAVPNGARVIDVAGKTIVPGYVDIHAHIWPAWGVHRVQPWEYLINLAYGVTTTRDPQTSTTDVITYGDLVETGDFIGPRILSTGPGVFSRDNIRNLEDARDVLKRYSEYYHTNTIKQYMVGERKVRQWVVMAAREQNLMPTLEGGLDFKKNLTEAMDGYSGSEHTLPIAPLYKDVVQLFAQSGDTYTPTLIVQYGGPWAENYWYENMNVIDDPKMNRFTPRHELEKKALRRPGWWAPSAWSFPLFAAQAAKIVAAGGRVGFGSHGQLQGLGAQWEIWNLASGGMPRHDVLRVATIFGAEAIGLGKYIGSIEPGKFADLQVLDANPLDDIKNTNTIRYVMKNGRLYDGNTLAEIWPRQKDVAKLWWQESSPAVTGQGSTRQE